MRAERLAARRSVSEAERSASDAAIVAAVADIVGRLFGPRLTSESQDCAPLIAAYQPMRCEPGGAQLPETLARLGVRVLLPVLRPDMDLDWAEYASAKSLVPASRGLQEPVGPRLGRSVLRRASAILVPALAVDRQGRRLGRGGGSYDRALARRSPDVPVIALLYDGDLVDEVPTEPHDQPVTAVITPSLGYLPLPG